MTRRTLLVLALLSVLASVSGCGDEGSPGPPTPGGVTPTAATRPPTAATFSPGTPIPPTNIGADVPANVFQNGSFESGQEPWFSLATEAWGTPFSVTTEASHSGSQSALLELRAPPEATGAKVFGVVQEVSPGEFPEVLSGYYRVENWEKATRKQYLQFVVIVWGADNLPGGYPNHQIRYPLAGIGEEPFEISNARFVFVGKDDPTLGEWVYFERPIRDDFRQAWSEVPTGYDWIRILFEVRYDDKEAGSQGQADVQYDDLYLGPADQNPNRP